MRSPRLIGSILAATGLAVGAPLVSGAAPTPAAPAAGPAQHIAAHAAPRLIPLPTPDHFQRRVTHRYFPLPRGRVWVYRGRGAAAGEREVVTVLDRTKRIEGIRATVVRDRATLRGTLVELTFDWYAQDDRGRVWYLGENTTAYDGGHTSKEGSWRTGVDGARAGVVMFSHRPLNRPYAQEFLAGAAEDRGVVLNRKARVVVPAGRFRAVWMTKDTTPLEPRAMELKFYAPGVGSVLELGTSPEFERLVLVRVRR
jgi:hypothetical protein